MNSHVSWVIITDSIFFIATILFGFVIPPIVLSHFSVEEYGRWLIIFQAVSLLGVIDFGVGIISTREVAKVTSDGKEIDLSNILIIQSFEICILFVLGVIGSIVAYFAFDQRGDYLWVASALLAWHALRPLFLLSEFLLRGLNQNIEASLSRLISIVTLNGILVVLISIGVGFKSFALSIIASGLIAAGYGYFIFFRKVKKNVKLVSRHKKEVGLSKLIKFSFYLAIGKLAAVLILSTDNLVIGYFLGATNVTIFAMTTKIIFLLKGFPGIVASSFLGYFTEKIKKKELALIKKNILHILRLSMYTSTSAVFVIMLLNEAFVKLWVGKNLYHSNLLTYIGCALIIREFLISGTRVLITASGDIKFDTFFTIVEAVLNILLSIILVHNYGVLGVLLGTIFSSILPLVYVTYKVNKLLGIAWSEFFSATFLGSLSSAVIGAMAVYGYFNGVSIENWLTLITVTGLFGFVFLLGFSALLKIGSFRFTPLIK